MLMTLPIRSAMWSDRRQEGSAALVVCLLPARNAADDLPGWFESVSRFADAVVALDDGSTDRTGDLLERHPLIRTLLRNPERSDHRDWDDSRNRNRLLTAAASLAPDWIISIDADERVPPEDGVALRRFIDERAVTGVAYGFPRYRMIGDAEHFDLLDSIVYRLFAFRPGQVFPPNRLHFMPAPTSIPRSRWLLSDIRIQHLVGLTDERRHARRQKYAEADPDGRWEDDADYALRPPGESKRWIPRRAGQPVVLEAPFAQRHTGGSLDLDGPVVSVALIVAEDEMAEMVAWFQAIERHDCSHPFEVLVLTLEAEVADDVARLLPRTTVVWLARQGSPGASRNVALGLARGDYLVCFDRPGKLAPGALDALVREHDAGKAVVTGAVENGTPSLAGWASYLDGPVHASFACEPMTRIGGFDERAGRAAEAEARKRLLAEGQRTGHNPLVVFAHRTELRSADAYLSDRFAAGRRGLPSSRPAAGPWRALRSGSPQVRRATLRVVHLVIAGWAASWLGFASRCAQHAESNELQL
jgi:Glycosyl transferase family 2